MKSPRRKEASKQERRSAVTLVELLVVLGILATVLGLLLPAVQRARHGAARLQCANNEKQLALAGLNYEASEGSFPEATIADVIDAYSCGILVLPYLEQDALYRGYKTLHGPISTVLTPHLDWTGSLPCGPGTESRRVRVALLLCPADREPAVNEPWLYDYYDRRRDSYAWCSGNGDLYAGGGVFTVTPGQLRGVRPPRRTKLTDIADGTSNTMLLSEGLVPGTQYWTSVGDRRLGNMGGAFFSTALPPNSKQPDRIWGPCPSEASDAGYKAPCVSLGSARRLPYYPALSQLGAIAGARSTHVGGGVNAGFCDGSVRWVSNDIRPATWAAQGTIAGGEH